MGRKPCVARSPKEKWQIVQEGIKSGNVSETCRRHSIAPNLFYRWKDEAEQGAKAALGGRDLAIGHDQDLAGTSGGLGLPGVRDRLLHAGDRGMASFTSLPDRGVTPGGLRGKSWFSLNQSQSAPLSAIGRTTQKFGRCQECLYLSWNRDVNALR
jgi:Transposase